MGLSVFYADPPDLSDLLVGDAAFTPSRLPAGLQAVDTECLLQSVFTDAPLSGHWLAVPDLHCRSTRPVTVPSSTGGERFHQKHGDSRAGSDV